jgi:hypothetical protein
MRKKKMLEGCMMAEGWVKDYVGEGKRMPSKEPWAPIDEEVYPHE